MQEITLLAFARVVCSRPLETKGLSWDKRLGHKGLIGSGGSKVQVASRWSRVLLHSRPPSQLAPSPIQRAQIASFRTSPLTARQHRCLLSFPSPFFCHQEGEPAHTMHKDVKESFLHIALLYLLLLTAHFYYACWLRTSRF